jgi:hypothetical protein
MKDVFLIITPENMNYLFELRSFKSNWEYSKQEKEIYKDDLGKIETDNCVFRFIKHVNVKQENDKFFLAKPDESEMNPLSDEEFDKQMMQWCENNEKRNGIVT